MFLIQLIIIQAITFTVLLFVLRKIMYSSSVVETKRLQLLNEENVKKSRELARKIEEAEAQYKEKILKAEEEIRKVKEQAKDDADKLKEEILNKARQESQQIVEQAMNVKDKIREELEVQLQDKTIEFSRKLIKDLLSSNNQKYLHDGLIDEILEEIEKMEFGKLQIKTDKGEFIVCFGLDKARRERIESIFLKKIGEPIVWEEKIDKGIIAGIVIKLGSFVIDGSLSGRLKEKAISYRSF